MRLTVVAAIIVAACFAASGWQIRRLDQRLDQQGKTISQLYFSCFPKMTGGGVWQCLQPNVRQVPPRK